MKTALVPARVFAGDSAAIPRELAKWVERFHAKCDWIVFPQIEVAATRGPAFRDVSLLHLQADLLGGFAAQRGVCIAAGFWETHDFETTGMIAMADRTGQLHIRSRKLTRETGPESAVGPLVLARIGNVPACVAMPDDLFDPSLAREAGSLSIKALALPMYVAASRSEFRGADALPPDLVEILDRVREVAKEIGAHVLAVNALNADKEPDHGPCGGAWVCDPQGEIAAERKLYEETPLEFEIP